MRYLTPLLIVLLASCAPVTQWLDDNTGTTIAERCETRRAAVAAWDAIEASGTDLTESQSSVRTTYQIYIDSVCPPLQPES